MGVAARLTRRRRARHTHRYKKDVADLMDVKSQVLVCERSLHDAKWEVEVLQQRFERVKAERDELYARFNATLYEVQQKSGFENLLVSAAAAGGAGLAGCAAPCPIVADTHARGGHARAQLEKKLEATSAAVEKKEVQLTEVRPPRCAPRSRCARPPGPTRSGACTRACRC